MEFHFEALSGNTQKTFNLLSGLGAIKDFYLAGGTGLALQLGHRLSNDLDFFSPESFVEQALIQKLSELGKFELEKKSEQTVTGVLNGTKIAFLGYKYPPLKSLKLARGIKIADVVDIGCMKIDAASSRGTKRDFVDVYFIAKEIMPLPQLLERFKRKYADLNYNMVHILKSLIYFEDAETDPMPQMLKRVDWEEAKSFFRDAIKNFS